MIYRLWQGRTRRDDADAYAAFLERRAIPDYRSVPGNIDVVLMRRDERDISTFIAMTTWVSEEAVRAFAGPDMDAAKYYPEDATYLLEFERYVQHYVVVSAASASWSPDAGL